MRYLLLLFVFLGSFLNVISQNQEIKHSNNKVTLHGQTFYIHIVRNGETLNAIARSYNISIDTVKKDNLMYNDELRINQYLKIRYNENTVSTEPKFDTHTVVTGDTPFNIAKRYGIKLDDLYKYNPGTELSIKLGDILRIPVMAKSHNTPIVQITKAMEKPVYFYLHQIEKKESFYGIAAIYYSSPEELLRYNPAIKPDSLVIGSFIKIPVTDKLKENDKEFHYHQVAEKQTAFSIAKLYGMKDKKLFKYNPAIKERGTQLNEFIKVPLSEASNIQDGTNQSSNENNTEKFIHEVKPAEDKHHQEVADLTTKPKRINDCPAATFNKKTKYKVAIFLPLYLNINDTLGKFIEVRKTDSDGTSYIELEARTEPLDDKVYQRSVNFIKFYEGALLALKNLKNQGVKLEVSVFDTQNDSAHIYKLLKENNLSSYNLFIGPIYSEMLNIVNDYAWEHKISIVSPLSLVNDFISSNPYAFAVSPSTQVQNKYASYFLNSLNSKNYIVIHDGKNVDQEYISEFKKELYQRMSKQGLMDISYSEVLYFDARDSVLRESFVKNQKNVVIIPSNDRAFVSDVMGKLNGYSYKFDILTFGQPRWASFSNIALDNFHNTNTCHFSTTDIDYQNPGVIKFINDYRKFYLTEPVIYSYLGYDVTYYFCSALNIYGPDFRKCIHQHKVPLLQSRFNFVPVSEQGGYQNTAIFLMEYTKDYKLKKAAVFP